MNKFKYGFQKKDFPLIDFFLFFSFCRLIKRELNTITANPRQTVDIDKWINTPENHPFGPYDISGPEANKLSLDEIRSKLSISDKDTNKSLEISVQQDGK